MNVVMMRDEIDRVLAWLHWLKEQPSYVRVREIGEVRIIEMSSYSWASKENAKPGDAHIRLKANTEFAVKGEYGMRMKFQPMVTFSFEMPVHSIKAAKLCTVEMDAIQAVLDSMLDANESSKGPFEFRIMGKVGDPDKKRMLTVIGQSGGYAEGEYRDDRQRAQGETTISVTEVEPASGEPPASAGVPPCPEPGAEPVPPPSVRPAEPKAKATKEPRVAKIKKVPMPTCYYMTPPTISVCLMPSVACSEEDCVHYQTCYNTEREGGKLEPPREWVEEQERRASGAAAAPWVDPTIGTMDQGEPEDRPQGASPNAQVREVASDETPPLPECANTEAEPIRDVDNDLACHDCEHRYLCGNYGNPHRPEGELDTDNECVKLEDDSNLCLDGNVYTNEGGVDAANCFDHGIEPMPDECETCTDFVRCHNSRKQVEEGSDDAPTTQARSADDTDETVAFEPMLAKPEMPHALDIGGHQTAILDETTGTVKMAGGMEEVATADAVEEDGVAVQIDPIHDHLDDHPDDALTEQMMQDGNCFEDNSIVPTACANEASHCHSYDTCTNPHKKCKPMRAIFEEGPLNGVRNPEHHSCFDPCYKSGREPMSVCSSCFDRNVCMNKKGE